MDTKPKPYTKPTPGPWRMIDRPSREGFCVNGPEYVICPDICAASLEQRRANAALIAAAPELLEALRDLANVVEAEALYYWTTKPSYIAARAAIAKAKGEQS